jgi:hypothetical protein
MNIKKGQANAWASLLFFVGCFLVCFVVLVYLVAMFHLIAWPYCCTLLHRLGIAPLLHHLVTLHCFFTLLFHLVTSTCYHASLFHLVTSPCFFTLLFCFIVVHCFPINLVVLPKFSLYYFTLLCYFIVTLCYFTLMCHLVILLCCLVAPSSAFMALVMHFACYFALFVAPHLGVTN